MNFDESAANQDKEKRFPLPKQEQTRFETKRTLVGLYKQGPLETNQQFAERSFPATPMTAGHPDRCVFLASRRLICSTTTPCSVQRENRRTELSNWASQTSIFQANLRQVAKTAVLLRTLIRLRLLFLAEFLKARVIPKRIEHGIEPEQRRSERLRAHSQPASVRDRE